MKKTLVVICAAVALVGCNQNRGGMSDRNYRDTGSSSSRNTTYPNSEDVNRNSSTLSTNTNTIAPTPAEPATVKPDQSAQDK